MLMNGVLDAFGSNAMVYHPTHSSSSILGGQVKYGGLFCVDENTINGSSFSTGRPLIKTCRRHFIKGWVFLFLREVGCFIHVKEFEGCHLTFLAMGQYLPCNIMQSQGGEWCCLMCVACSPMGRPTVRWWWRREKIWNNAQAMMRLWGKASLW